MLFLPIAQDYFLWHYTRAFSEILHVWTNLLWFVIHFFSLPQLFKSWFSPFRRITEQKRKGGGFEDWLGYIIINILSRLVGAFMRTVLMLVGIVCLTLAVIGGVLVYILWIGLPLIAVGLLVTGISLLFL